jgi:cytochrome c oxidase subunit 2
MTGRGRAWPRSAAAALLAALASGCVDDHAMLSPAGPAARLLAALGWPILIGFTLTSVVMWALVAWAAVRRRGTLATHAPIDAGGGNGWVLVGGFLIPGVAFAATFVATLRTMDAFPMAQHDHGKPEVRVTGHQWWWQVEYVGGAPSEQFATANEIHIPVGRAVTIELRSVDVIHSLWVPRLQGKVDLIPGIVNRMTLQADRPGVYPGSCSELCGVQHAHMRLLVVAEDAATYERWLARERQVAAAPVGEEAELGRSLFEQRACVVCHTVRGTGARATVGPDLTHLASRLTLGAGSFPNDVATLHAWIMNAPSLKPGVRMPALTQFDGPQLHQLVAYLRGLR